MTGRLLIVGASARAAAASALRAGLEPMSIDLFADRDLAALPALRVPARSYPAAIPSLARTLPPAPFLYTGALENHPGVIARLAAGRELWGNPPAAIEKARDPLLIHRVLADAGLPSPRVQTGGAGMPRGEWLRKPIRGGGGRGIWRLTGEGRAGTNPRRRASDFYLQEWIDGIPLSALFLAGREGTALLGITRQLVGEADFGARPFAYCGSIGPFDPGPAAADSIARIGETLAAAFELVGLFGVDFILRGETPWPLEVNPRYPASAEVVEESLRAPILELHARACHRGAAPEGAPEAAREATASRGRGAAPPGNGRAFGKAILYARRAVSIPEALDLERAADLPRPGERIPKGRPILTVFASGSSVEDCRRALTAAADRAYRAVEGLPPAGPVT